MGAMAAAPATIATPINPPQIDHHGSVRITDGRNVPPLKGTKTKRQSNVTNTDNAAAAIGEPNVLETVALITGCWANMTPIIMAAPSGRMVDMLMFLLSENR